tara:strand:+ start:108 stop:362 length:255 start_codon:yes stop_codon:yes gene_type:complete
VEAVRVWASCRGQTLCRTAFGMLEYEAALAFQAALEAMPAERPVGASGAAGAAAPLGDALEAAMAGAMVRAREKLDVVFSCQVH